MSIKTLRKRIALVAVSALGLGLLSVTPASADDGDIAVTALDYAATVGTIGSADATDNAQTWTVVQTGKVRITFDGVANGYVQLSGPCYFVASSLGTNNTITNANTRVTTPGTNNAVVDIVPSGVGTCIASAYNSATAVSTSDKLTLTIVASSTVGSLSAADSFARIETSTEVSAGAEVTNNSDVAGASRVANGGQGYVGFTLHDQNDQAMPASTVVGCSVTGGAVCSFTSQSFFGPSASTTYDGDDYDTIFIAQGVKHAAIDSVMTITVNGAVWLTKSFTLLGDVAKITLSGTETSTGGGIYADASADDGTIGLKITDALGRLLTSKTATVSATSYNNSVTGYGTFVTGSSTSLASDISYTCSSTEGSADVTVSMKNDALATITSNTFKVWCTEAADSFTASLDKATYTPGEIATLTITAKSPKGNPAADSSTLGSTSKPVSISGSNLTAVTAPTNSHTFTNGVKKYTFIVGSTEGAYQLAVDLPIVSSTAVAVPYTIKASSASVTNAEVLSAIVKLIASINKQIRALQKSLRR
jgi:hypothetical protein